MGFNSGFKGLNAGFYTICHLLALLGAHHILHVSRISVKRHFKPPSQWDKISLRVQSRPLIKTQWLRGLSSGCVKVKFWHRSREGYVKRASTSNNSGIKTYHNSGLAATLNDQFVCQPTVLINTVTKEMIMNPTSCLISLGQTHNCLSFAKKKTAINMGISIYLIPTIGFYGCLIT